MSGATHLVHLTLTERDALVAHMDPSDDVVLDALHHANITGPLASLELTPVQLQRFLTQLEYVALGAQNLRVQSRIGAALERIDAGLKGRADPGAHLLRPAAAARQFTYKQGQYLAFIDCYSRLHRRAPSEADIQAWFGTAAPSVHAMLKMLQRKRLIARSPGTARSIRLLVKPHEIPELE